MSKKFVIHTRNGNTFDPATGVLDVVDVKDVAHALSNITRYAGHCREFYSVAEHSVLVSRVIHDMWPTDIEARWAGLLHDATEAYVVDVPTPLKVLLPEYKRIEDALTKTIAKELGIKWSKAIQLKVDTADKVALATEAGQLFDDVSDWTSLDEYVTAGDLLNPEFPMGPGKARDLFLKEVKIVKKELKAIR